MTHAIKLQKAKPIRPAPIVASPNTKKQKVVVTSDTSPTCEEHVKKNIPLEVVDLIVSEVSEEPTGEILGGVDLSGALVQVTKLLLGDTFSSGVPLPPNLSLGGLPRLSYRGVCGWLVEVKRKKVEFLANLNESENRLKEKDEELIVLRAKVNYAPGVD
ncbi:hypothetical protein VIGAN_08156500 [Vigna angularis var. angularis]|uniref:Uncharacterized protein n=1 Tax=Vigna angularis var. angularis TaxID=157739 RepID=A0A0S3SQ29_PHAAN|nr:hypothetical protein VIGAN_08156500 [Vigna angularis var. angularis]